MPYIPHSDADRQAMLETIGLESLEDLFDDVPAHTRYPSLQLPPAVSELGARWELGSLAEANLTAGEGSLIHI